MQERQKIFLDTDIGDDIDDALALAYALRHPALDLIGVSTVFRNTACRKRLTQRFLATFGRPDIPVGAGVGRPLIAPADVNEIPCQWKDAYGGLPEGSGLHGVALMLEKLRQNPDAALVAVGPLTNVACAVRLAPELMENTPVFLMGGLIGRQEPEWNILCDPEAAAIVFSGCRKLTMVGLDVTARCQLSQADVDAIRNSGTAEMRLLTEMIDSWMAISRHLPYLHDPLTVAYAAQPQLLTLAPHRIHVVLEGALRGATVPCEDAGLPVAQTAVDVEPPAAARDIMQTICTKTL